MLASSTRPRPRHSGCHTFLSLAGECLYMPLFISRSLIVSNTYSIDGLKSSKLLSIHLKHKKTLFLPSSMSMATSNDPEARVFMPTAPRINNMLRQSDS